eukprot:5761872-Pleurochrysis_carterae.AAC.2
MKEARASMGTRCARRETDSSNSRNTLLVSFGRKADSNERFAHILCVLRALVGDQWEDDRHEVHQTSIPSMCPRALGSRWMCGMDIRSSPTSLRPMVGLRTATITDSSGEGMRGSVHVSACACVCVCVWGVGGRRRRSVPVRARTDVSESLTSGSTPPSHARRRLAHCGSRSSSVHRERDACVRDEGGKGKSQDGAVQSGASRARSKTIHRAPRSGLRTRKKGRLHAA